MSVKLSDLLIDCVSDIKTSPEEKDMSTIVDIVERVSGADVALRLQLEQKMDFYHKKKISEQEMLNCLVLTDYVSQNSIYFRTQVAELSFITRLQLIGKMKLKHEKANKVETKVRELIAVWGTYYENQMYEYATLYRKYCMEKVINPIFHPVIYLPPELTKLIPHVEHNLRNITRYIECGIGDLDIIYKHAKKLNTKFNKQIHKAERESHRYDQQRLMEMIEFGHRLDDSMKDLEQELEKRNLTKEVDVEDVPTSIKEGAFIHPTFKKSTLHVGPPPVSSRPQTVFPSRYESPSHHRELGLSNNQSRGSPMPSKSPFNNRKSPLIHENNQIEMFGSNENRYMNDNDFFDFTNTSNESNTVTDIRPKPHKSLSPGIFDMDDDDLMNSSEGFNQNNNQFTSFPTFL